MDRKIIQLTTENTQGNRNLIQKPLLLSADFHLLQNLIFFSVLSVSSVVNPATFGVR
jgi:hypothetical protein